MTQIKLDTNTLPLDGRFCKYQTLKGEWKVGYWDAENEQFNESKDGGDFDWAWHVLEWEEINNFKEVNKV